MVRMPEEPRVSGRELSRRRRGTYGGAETGRHHHIGAAPANQPRLGDEGAAEYVQTAAVQLAARTGTQLRRQRARHQAAMRAAAERLDFETAARERDSVAAVTAELDRRGAATEGQPPPAPPAPVRPVADEAMGQNWRRE